MRRRIFLFLQLLDVFKKQILLMFLADSLWCNAIEIVTFLSFSPWNGRQYWFCLGFQSWFSGSVYVSRSRIAEFVSALAGQWKTFNFEFFPFSECLFVWLFERTHPPRLGRSCAFFFFFASVKCLWSWIPSTKFALSQTLKKWKSAPVGRPASGLSSDGNLAGKFKNITKKEESVSCHSQLNAGTRKEVG